MGPPLGDSGQCTVFGDALWFPTLAPEKRREDGARKIIQLRWKGGFGPSTSRAGNGLAFELLVEPAGEGLELFVAAEEVADHLAAGLGAALFEDRFAIAGAGIAAQRIGGVELAEEVERDHLVEGIGVVVRRVAGEVAEAGVHAVPVDPGPGLEALIEILDDAVEIDGLGVLVVEIE